MKFFLVSILAGTNWGYQASAKLFLRRATSNGMDSNFGVDPNKSLSFSMASIVAAANQMSKNPKNSKSSKTSKIGKSATDVPVCKLIEITFSCSSY